MRLNGRKTQEGNFLINVLSTRCLLLPHRPVQVVNPFDSHVTHFHYLWTAALFFSCTTIHWIKKERRGNLFSYPLFTVLNTPRSLKFNCTKTVEIVLIMQVGKLVLLRVCSQSLDGIIGQWGWGWLVHRKSGRREFIKELATPTLFRLTVSLESPLFVQRSLSAGWNVKEGELEVIYLLTTRSNGV